MSTPAGVAVSIVSAVVVVSPPAWRIEFEVRNHGDATLWVIADESLVFRQDDGRIELSYARGRMQPGAQVFGYFDPEVVALAPGASVRRWVEIAWPCRLSGLWNDRPVAAPSPDEYDVAVRVGFASTPSPPAAAEGEHVEAPVLRWQRAAVSRPIRIAVPPYEGAP